jgi:hypothetical protein
MPSQKQKLSVYLSRDEYQGIKKNAGRAGLSFSRFAKMVCLGEQVKSLEAQEAILELLRFRADLGRLGGLLKLWLADKDRHATEARRILRELESNQKKIWQAIQNLEAHQ